MKKMLSFYQKNIFLVSNMFMQMFNVSALCTQTFQNVPEINMGGVEFLIQALSKPNIELQMAVINSKRTEP